MSRTVILGISAFYHDSAAALIVDGEIIAAAQEERFSRIRHDSNFPKQAIEYILKESGIEFSQLTAVTFYDKPLLTFERLLETYHAFAPRGLRSFITAIPVWVKGKLFMKKELRKQLAYFGKHQLPILFTEHHLSHAASAFFPSPYEEAAILTVDGVGEWATSTISKGKTNTITICKELHFPHSVGLLYSAFTYYLGFRVNSGEYKLMGLASYGHVNSQRTKLYKEKILEEIVDVREDGSILLNMKFFNFATKLTMTNDSKWESLLGVSRREPESEITQEHMDLAIAIQMITESVVIALTKTAKKITGCKNLVMAGGVALNCVANSKVLETGIFDNVWVQPASGDAGGALGAVLATHHIYYGKERIKDAPMDTMNNGYLGPQYSNIEIERVLNGLDVPFKYFEKFEDLSAIVSQKIADGKIIGWFQGRMEYGPRALGNRSILADPRNPETQRKLNLKIKFREAFRPFAPSVLAEDVKEYYAINHYSPYMLFVAQLTEQFRKPEPEEYQDFEMFKRLYHVRSEFPAVTHIDYSSRIQTVDEKSNYRFWHLIKDFKKLTSCGMLVNTSFNVRGEPIVCSPKHAYDDFLRTEMDTLVMGNYLIDIKSKNIS
ncbi:MAG: carbamoyltransferase [Reichenbachiella sp.]